VAPAERRRIACLLVPDLPLAAELRAHPELAGLPLAVASGPGPRAELVSVSAEAARRGVRPGSSVTHARAVCAELVVRVASPALEQAARAALLDAAFSFSPRAALAPRDSGAFAAEAAVHLDASGITSLFHSEAGFAAALGARAHKLGLPAHVAIASTRSIARIAARPLAAQSAEGGRSRTKRPLAAQPAEGGRSRTARPMAAQSAEGGRSRTARPMAARRRRAQGARGERSRADGPQAAQCADGEPGVRVLAPGDEAAFLAPLPIDILDPDDALAETLTRFGVRTVHDLLALPRRALSTRLGPGVLDLIARVRGERSDPPLSVPAQARLAEAIDLDHPVDRLQPLVFVLQGLLSRLLDRLETRHLACGDLDIHLDLAEGGRDARSIGIAAPTRDLRVLVRLVAHALEARAPEAPVEAVHLETEGRPLRGDQLDLFRPAGPAPAVLGETLAALESLCGAERVGAPVVRDDHHPDAFGMRPFDPRRAPAPTALSAAHRAATSRAVEEEPGACSGTGMDHESAPPPASHPPQSGRLFTGPLAIRALRPPLAAQVQLRGPRPDHVRSPIANGDVVRLAGPWRTTGGWWSAEGRFAFDHFDVQTSDGSVVRLRLDHVRHAWQIDAIYD
jgi:protein ImuB